MGPKGGPRPWEAPFSFFFLPLPPSSFFFSLSLSLFESCGRVSRPWHISSARVSSLGSFCKFRSASRTGFATCWWYRCMCWGVAGDQQDFGLEWFHRQTKLGARGTWCTTVVDPCVWQHGLQHSASSDLELVRSCGTCQKFKLAA